MEIPKTIINLEALLIALAQQTEPSNTYSHDQDGKTQNITKRNYKNLKDNDQPTS